MNFWNRFANVLAELTISPLKWAMSVWFFVFIGVTAIQGAKLIHGLTEPRDWKPGECLTDLRGEPWESKILPVHKIVEVGRKYYRIKSFTHVSSTNSRGFTIYDTTSPKEWSGVFSATKISLKFHDLTECPKENP